MKCFKELMIKIPSYSHKAFFKEVEKILTSGWLREKDKELQMNKNALSGEYFIFHSTQAGNNHDVGLFFISSPDNVKIANIVPRDVPELTIDEYNAILDNFNNSFIIPIAERFSYDVVVTSDSKTLNDILKTKDARDALIRFSDCANKTTGTAHPADHKRWYEFVVTAFMLDDKPSSYYLKGWLIEEDWEPDKASDIIIEFEQEWEVLEYYKQRQ